ncbi:lytic transglycosylase domain-containing protein [Burkholderia ubonensis]|uniref:lytic transglycosylase domain-containing protein n=1 Tax=Burkholderia ubonensis TaxID=101571 RepID=UPI00075DDA0E|nr:lytic transglycosylase domain-containing protein [Burkholderia ubonensis]
MFWLSAELPPEIPPACVVQAASHYSIPAELLVAIVRQEGGQVGKVYPRSHGTYFGPYQISDKWLSTFAKWGYDAKVLTHNACANVYAGAYVLAYYKAREPNWQRAIARYNVGSLDTPDRVDAGTRYARKVIGHWWNIYTKWTASANGK